MNPQRRRALAVLYGGTSHVCFAAAIASMIAGLWTGMTWGAGALEGPCAWIANALLALQFPLVHSLLPTRRGRRVLARLAPRDLGGDLSSTIYAGVAALQLLATFWLWSPTGISLWSCSERTQPLFVALFGGAWLLLVKALWDGGMGIQTGWIGWTAVLRGRRPDFGALRTSGLFACCRQPIYLSFALTLWTGPGWTADHLLLAVLWTIYCWVAPLHKEQRYERIFGEAFAMYRRRVPYFFPRLPR